MSESVSESMSECVPGTGSRVEQRKHAGHRLWTKGSRIGTGCKPEGAGGEQNAMDQKEQAESTRHGLEGAGACTRGSRADQREQDGPEGAR